ncbi:DNA repair protein RecN [bacterium]|nr:DNA repair protein RecN [bacterium]
MLVTLRIKRLAIIDELELDLEPGLNVITGETGAGKSILLKAIDMLTGKRVSGDAVRSGAKDTEVEGLFTFEPEEIKKLQELYGEELLEADEEEIIIRRVVDLQGKSKAAVNGRLCTLSKLQELSRDLLDITSQHDQQTLLSARSQRRLLDANFIAPALLTHVATSFREYKQCADELEAFLAAQQEKDQRLARISAELEELDTLDLSPTKREDLEAELSRLANTEQLREITNQIETIFSGDGSTKTGGLNQLAKSLQQELVSLQRIDQTASLMLERAHSAFNELTDIQFEVEKIGTTLDADPQYVEGLRKLLSDISRVERRYSKQGAELFSYYLQIKQEFNDLTQSDSTERRLREKCESARKILASHQEKLTEARKQAADKLIKLIPQELAKVNLAKARFNVVLEPCPASAEGQEEVRFYFSANPGEKEAPLEKVASGGELSRLLLVLKTIVNKRSGAGLQVFDEIDTGVGGAVAQSIGEKLSAVSEHTQVIVVTHAPQVAAFADSHFVVAKESDQKTTRTFVRKLTDKDQVSELARMLAGKEVTREFEESARRLLSLRN